MFANQHSPCGAVLALMAHMTRNASREWFGMRRDARCMQLLHEQLAQATLQRKRRAAMARAIVLGVVIGAIGSAAMHL